MNTQETTNSEATLSPRGKDAFPVFVPVGATTEGIAARIDAVRAVFDAVRLGEKAGQALFREVKIEALRLYPDHEALAEVKEADVSAIRAEYEALGMAKSLIAKAVKAAQNNYQPLINAIKRGASRADIMASGKSGLERANAQAKKLVGLDLGENLEVGKDPLEVIADQAEQIKEQKEKVGSIAHLFNDDTGELLLAPVVAELLKQGITASTIADQALKQEKITAEAVKVAAM